MQTDAALEKEGVYAKSAGLKGFDIFGQPIGLIYKGESTFQTRCGGIFSILIWILMICKVSTDIARMSETFTKADDSHYVRDMLDREVWTLPTD